MLKILRSPLRYHFASIVLLRSLLNFWSLCDHFPFFFSFQTLLSTFSLSHGSEMFQYHASFWHFFSFTGWTLTEQSQSKNALFIQVNEIYCPFFLFHFSVEHKFINETLNLLDLSFLEIFLIYSILFLFHGCFNLSCISGF